MKPISNSRLFSTALFLLSIMVMAKVIWLALSLLFLPNEGVEHSETAKIKPLYYPIKLANSSPKIAAPQSVQTPKKTVGSMSGYTLVALYHASDALVVTVEKSKKTKVLAKGEDIDGFVLNDAGSNYALFTKGGKEFKLLLQGSKKESSSSIRVNTSPTGKKATPQKDTEAIQDNEDGLGKRVSKNLLTSYTKDIEKVWKDIGIAEYKENGAIKGFRVNFVKQGSDFQKLGLEKGDILTSINGQELNSYNAAFSFYKEIDSIENLTLNIKRNNQEMELEYEIQ
ncbi:MAG TPA: hypothetical protein ENK86_02935 [Campylobacterales bacterium]|nr:hypothetical protein [Campylobacterales bacterium]